MLYNIYNKLEAVKAKEKIMDKKSWGYLNTDKKCIILLESWEVLKGFKVKTIIPLDEISGETIIKLEQANKIQSKKLAGLSRLISSCKILMIRPQEEKEEIISYVDRFMNNLKNEINQKVK